MTNAKTFQVDLKGLYSGNNSPGTAFFGSYNYVTVSLSDLRWTLI